MSEPSAARPKQVHQLLAALSYGDAISNEALAIQRHLREKGYASDIFCEAVHPRLAGRARRLWEYESVSGPDTVCIFHFALRSAAARLIYHAPDRLVCIYHNITPAHFFVGYHDGLAGLCYHGRRELSAFAPRTELALGDSEFNRKELEESGFTNTAVLPIVMDPDAYRRPPSPIIRNLYADGRTNILFVGRIIPNKKIEDVIRAYAVYRKWYDRSARLLLVGDHRGYERYLDRLYEQVEAYGLTDVEDVVFTGHVDDDELMGYFSVGDLYLSLSDHEGFCVPLLEAMMKGIPVVAYDAGAVRETMRGGGVLLTEKPPELVAEVMSTVLTDAKVRAAVLATQERALLEIRGTHFGTLLDERLRPVLDQGPR